MNSKCVELFRASAQGDEDQLKFLLADGASVNCVNEKGWTPLIVAAFNQHLDAVKILVNAGANVNHQSIKGTTVFMYAKTKALESGNYELLDFLLQSGADINKRDFKQNWTVLQYVEKIGNFEMINYLEKKGAAT